MKNVKKLLSIVMVLTLVLSLGASALAVNVTIDGDHDYVAYQVFKGTQDPEKGDDAPLGQVEWGDGVNKETILAALKADSTIDKSFQTKEDGTEILTAADVAEVVAGFTEGSAELRAFGKVVLANKATGTPLTGEGSKNELPVGYYVIEDTTDLEGADTQNDIIIQVTKDVDITIKHDIPESHKKVQDINDSTDGKLTEWQSSADWDIGDQVPFQLSGTVQQKNYDSYTTYYMSFVDVMSPGLQYVEDSYKVYYIQDGEEVDLTDDFTMTGPTAYTSEDPTEAKFNGGTTFSWTCNDIKALDVPAGATIYVEYKAELLDKAVIGEAGNPNKSHIEFSNKPGDTSHGKTPDETVIVFTYQLNTKKVDEDIKDLEGAGFTLLKKLPALPADATAGKWEDIEGAGLEEGAYYEKDGNYYQIVGVSPAADGKTTFDFKGLDDGEYVLVESEVPAGFNKAADIEFEVVPEHAKDGITLQKLTVKADGKAIDSSTTDGAFSIDQPNGMIQNQVVNKSGVELPETGGIGTTIFYIVGAVLVAGAVILLVTKKRVSGAEK